MCALMYLIIMIIIIILISNIMNHGSASYVYIYRDEAKKQGHPYIRTSLTSQTLFLLPFFIMTICWRREQGLCDAKLVLMYGRPFFPMSSLHMNHICGS